MGGNSFVIRLESFGEKPPLEGRFARHGLLFLFAQRGEFALGPLQAEGSLGLAVFSKRGGKIWCNPLHPTARLPFGDGGQIKDGAAFQVGTAFFTIKIIKPQLARRLRFSMYLGCMILFATAFFFAALQHRGIPAGKKVSTRPQTVNSAASARSADFISEAKAFLQEGKTAQARLSLIAASEAAPDDERIKTLLENLNERPETSDNAAAPDREAADEDAEDLAVTLFREGERQKESGELSQAFASFDRALRISRGFRALPPSLAALESERELLAEKIKAQMSVRMSAIAESLDRNMETDAKIATKNRTLELQEINGMFRAFPDDADILALKARIEKSLSAVSDRWMAAALAAEKFSGCAKARPMYEEIANALAPAGDHKAATAREGMERCKK